MGFGFWIDRILHTTGIREYLLDRILGNYILRIRVLIIRMLCGTIKERCIC